MFFVLFLCHLEQNIETCKLGCGMIVLPSLFSCFTIVFYTIKSFNFTQKNTLSTNVFFQMSCLTSS